MFLFALISEVPFDLAFSGKAWYPAYQNVFFTLLLGLLVIAGLHLVEQHFVGTTVGKNDSARGTECRYYSDRMCTGLGS